MEHKGTVTQTQEDLEMIRARVPLDLKRRAEHASVDLGATIQEFVTEALELRLAHLEGPAALQRALKALERKSEGGGN